MFNLTGMTEQARFFCVLGYSRDTVIAQLTAAFPNATPEAIESAWTAAVAQRELSERQLDAAVAAEDRKALAAEHDLSSSMHDA